MGVEKRNPLPPGTYWIDTIKSTRARSGMGDPPDPYVEFPEWLKTHSGVTLVRREDVSGTIWPSSPARSWYLFTVPAGVVADWDATRFGYPTISDEGTDTQEADTSQRPPPEPTWSEQVESVAAGLATGTKVVVAGVLLAGLLALYKKAT